MQPVPEWRRVLRHAWSIRWIAAAIVLGLIEAVVTVLDPPNSQALRVGFAALGSIAGTGAVFARCSPKRSFGSEQHDGITPPWPNQHPTKSTETARWRTSSRLKSQSQKRTFGG